MNFSLNRRANTTSTPLLIAGSFDLLSGELAAEGVFVNLSTPDDGVNHVAGGFDHDRPVAINSSTSVPSRS